jgi:hypothetical protein
LAAVYPVIAAVLSPLGLLWLWQQQRLSLKIFQEVSTTTEKTVDLLVALSNNTVVHVVM